MPGISEETDSRPTGTDADAADVFISYVHEDADIAIQFVSALRNRNWKVWWDRNILPGADIRERVEYALTHSKCVVVLWTALSVKAEWVRAEADDARDRRKLVQVLVDDVKLPLPFGQVQAVRLPYPGATGFEEREAALYEGIQQKVAPRELTPLVDPREGHAKRPAPPSAGGHPLRRVAMATLLGCMAIIYLNLQVADDDLLPAVRTAALFGLILSPIPFGLYLGLGSREIKLRIYFVCGVVIGLCSAITVIVHYSIDDAILDIPWITVALFLVFGPTVLFATSALTGRLFKRRPDGTVNSRRSAERFAAWLLSQFTGEISANEIRQVAGWVRFVGPLVGLLTAVGLTYGAYSSLG